MIDSYAETRKAYLGSFPIDISETEFANYTKDDWAIRFIVAYGGFDGSHHKSWVIDQVARILRGTPVIVEVRKWGPTSQYPEGHTEPSFWTGEPSAEYITMVKEARYDPKTDDPDGYDWDEGTAP